MGNLYVRIRAGGGEQSPFLPRQRGRINRAFPSDLFVNGSRKAHLRFGGYTSTEVPQMGKRSRQLRRSYTGHGFGSFKDAVRLF
jgi:hypothetical protein